MIKLPAPGQPLHRVEKWAPDKVTYIFDQSDVLEVNEIIVKINSPKNTRSRRGVYLEVSILPGEITGAAPFQQYR